MDLCSLFSTVSWLCIFSYILHDFRGLGIERILVSLIFTYNDPGNLVIVLGTTTREEEYLLSQLENRGISPLPRCITSEYSVSERWVILICTFIRSSIMLILLKGRICAAYLRSVMIFFPIQYWTIKAGGPDNVLTC